MYYFSHDVLLKEQLAARGFVSDVTVKRREEALLVKGLSHQAAFPLRWHGVL